MKKDNITKRILRRRRKELRHRFFKLSNLKWMIAILLCSIGLLVASYYVYECNPWLSGVFVSAGCGGLTGLVLYFLSNLRNNKIAILQKELATLKSISNILNHIDGFKNYYQNYRTAWGEKRSISEDGYKVASLLEELQDVVDNMPQELYDIFEIASDNPLSFENQQLFKSRLLNTDDDSETQICMDDISKHFATVKDKIFDLTNEKEDQLMLFGRFFL